MICVLSLDELRQAGITVELTVSGHPLFIDLLKSAIGDESEEECE